MQNKKFHYLKCTHYYGYLTVFISVKFFFSFYQQVCNDYKSRQFSNKNICLMITFFFTYIMIYQYVFIVLHLRDTNYKNILKVNFWAGQNSVNER